MGVFRAAGSVAALTAVFAAGVAGSEPASGGKAERPARPNVVVVMSDDQTQDSMRYMPRTQALLGNRGASFATSVTNWPLCCPSRATFLTGRYAHNHGVLGNTAPVGGFDRLDSSKTLPVWLQRAGYFTAHVGKYLNGYENSPVGVPPGWSEWHGSKRTYVFYGYQLLEGGELVTYGSTAENPDAPADPGVYSTDVYTDKAVELIERRAPGARPFFLSVAYLAPHSGGPNPDPPNQSRCNNTAKPAPRHFGRFASEPLPLPPSFNETDVADKPAGLAGRPSLTAEQVQRATRNYRCRAESLLAIDDGVGRIVEALRAAGELDRTLIVYTSDNGFFHGEHRVLNGKNRVYEEAIRVPLLIRGPGIPKGVVSDDLAVNADLAPTVLAATGAQASLPLDGISLFPLAEHPERMRGRELLIEQSSGAGESEDDAIGGVFYDAIRNARYTYVQNATGELELYDLRKDPFQLQNQISNPAYDAAEAALAKRLARLRNCAGASCRSRPDLRLELPRSIREGGRSCRRPGAFVARLRGSGAAGLVRARFAIGSEGAGRVGEAPWKKKIRPSLLREGRGRPEIRVIAELLDGRVLSVQRRTRICRRA